MAEELASTFTRTVPMNSLTLDSPAKINLMLSVHGRRSDGFHALTSVVVALAFGDRLCVSVNASSVDRLRCSDRAVPTGEANLILQAAEVFRASTRSEVHFDFDLEKRIPMGAGLGGGSSNAAVALQGMNELAGHPLSNDELRSLAASLGSDCPFFIDAVPSVMTGRGERLDPLDPEAIRALAGHRVLLFRPDFAIETAWAYRRLIVSDPPAYETAKAAQARLAAFAQTGSVKDLLHNTFEHSVGLKFLAIPCLLEALREAGHACLLSGSGSCCFALVEGAEEAAAVRRICEAAWGSGIFFIETSIA